MKRHIILLITIAAAAFAGIAQDNRSITFGARLGMDITFPTGNSNIYKTGSGFSAGAVAAIPLPDMFFVEPGLMFSYTSMTAKDLVSFDDKYYYQGAANIYSLRVPVNVGYTFALSDNASMSIFTGPYINLNVSARQHLAPNFSNPVPVPDRTVNLFDHGWRHAEGGWSIGLSTVFAEHYFVGITGGVDFTPLASYGDNDIKIRIHRASASITLGYNF